MVHVFVAELSVLWASRLKLKWRIWLLCWFPVRTSEASARPGPTGLVYRHAGALFLTLGPQCWGERWTRVSETGKGMREALRQMKMLFPRSLHLKPNPHPPSLPLTPQGPWGSQFWSLSLFPLVAFGPVIRLLFVFCFFSICKKWLLFKVKFCLQKCIWSKWSLFVFLF